MGCPRRGHCIDSHTDAFEGVGVGQHDRARCLHRAVRLGHSHVDHVTTFNAKDRRANRPQNVDGDIAGYGAIGRCQRDGVGQFLISGQTCDTGIRRIQRIGPLPCRCIESPAAVGTGGQRWGLKRVLTLVNIVNEQSPTHRRIARASRNVGGDIATELGLIVRALNTKGRGLFDTQCVRAVFDLVREGSGRDV